MTRSIDIGKELFLLSAQTIEPTANIRFVGPRSSCGCDNPTWSVTASASGFVAN